MMRSKQSGLWGAAVLAIAVGLLAAPAIAGPASMAAANVSAHGIDWQPSLQYEKIVLTVTGPEGLVLRREFAAGVMPSFDAVGADGGPLADGSYTYELVAAPVLDRATKRALANARRNGDDTIVEKLRAEGKLPSTDMIQSGSFRVADGVLVAPDTREEPAAGGGARTKAAPRPVTADTQVINMDLIVQGSECVGIDCTSGETFGFDTIRLKENNLRIKFEDTSVGTFPSTDWQLTANDSASGGQNRFSIEDISAARVPFTITGGATTNSIFVASTGRVGLRTSTPVLDLHINTSNTPGIRLEQNSSGGFSAQSWDIAGNETNFFIRDVTNGSLLPFRIRPGAPTSSIDIAASGNVGVGTLSPTRRLTVVTTGAADDTVLELQNNAATRIRINNTNNGEIWNIGHQSPSGTGFVISDVGDATSEMLMDTAGNVTFAGTVTPSSSRTVKEQFSPVDSRDVLQRVLDLPITSWNYKSTPGVRHVGPMAEDFYASFHVGADDKGISVTDSAGVALAAIQGLNQVIQEKDKEISQLSETMGALRHQNEELAARLAAIEQKLKSRVE